MHLTKRSEALGRGHVEHRTRRGGGERKNSAGWSEGSEASRKAGGTSSWLCPLEALVLLWDFPPSPVPTPAGDTGTRVPCLPAGGSLCSTALPGRHLTLPLLAGLQTKSVN